MKPLGHYSIPVKGMNLGPHEYHFLLENSFFGNYEESPVKEGVIEVKVVFDKRPNMITADFEVSGKIGTECDRCLQKIALPIENEYQLVIKYSETEREEDDVIYINEEKSDLNIADYLYEFVVLSLPISKVYDCENDPSAPCDKQTLKYLEKMEFGATENSIWEELKKVNKEEN